MSVALRRDTSFPRPNPSPGGRGAIVDKYPAANSLSNQRLSHMGVGWRSFVLAHFEGATTLY